MKNNTAHCNSYNTTNRNWYHRLARWRNNTSFAGIAALTLVLTVTAFIGIPHFALFARRFLHCTNAMTAVMTTGTTSTTTTRKPFSLLVTLKFTSTQYKDQFLEDFRPLAEYVREHEPTTLSYETLLSDQDPLQVLILERYQNKDEAYLKIHKSSSAFLEFRPKLQQMQQGGLVVVSGHSYVDSGIGFGDRSVS